RRTVKTGLTAARAAEVRQRFGTPTYVYERAALEAAARAALAFPAPFGYTLRYAMKANPNHGILGLFRELGLHIDASSDHEVERAGKLPEGASINLGGGFQVGRMPGEPAVYLVDVGSHVRRELEAFRERDGRALHLEIEPGTYLVATAGSVVATCVDVVDTGR